MTVKFSNSGKALITSTVYTHSQTVDVDDASVFPSIVDYGNDYFYVTFQAPSTGNSEICKVTDVIGNKLFIERAQDGTTASSFGAGDKCENRLNAGALIEAVNDFDITSQTDPKYLRSNTDDTTTHVITSHSDAKWPLVIGKFVGGSHNQKIKLQGSASPNIDFCSEQHERMMFGYSSLGYGQWYVHDGDNNSARLKLDEDGTLKLTATVSADGVTSETYSDATVFHSGLFTNNATNWDTAYSWGDHADAGYLTSESASLQDVTNRGNTLTTNIKFTEDEGGIEWYRNTDSASIKFYNDSDADTNSRLEFNIRDNKNEFFLFTSYNHTTLSDTELLKIHPTADMTLRGNKVYDAGDFTNNATNWDTAHGWGDHSTAGYLTSHQDISGKLDKSGGTLTGALTVSNVEISGSSIGDGAVGLLFQPNADYKCIHPTTLDGEAHAGSISFGWSNNKWKDGYFAGVLYASGGDSDDWNTAYGWGDHASAGYLTSHQDISGKVDVDKGYRTVDTADATAGPGWITVAKNTDGRKHGEVIVCDKDSSDHAFIRIDFLRSYVDKDFTVLQHGGHANRITGVRILEETDDRTYGDCYLQVYVTQPSRYYVKVNQIGDNEFLNHTAVIPVVQDTISGNQVYGNELTGLTGVSFACEESIKVGGKVVANTGDSDDWSEAHGWGNHSTAGYLTSHQDISGKLDKSGGTLTGALTINTANANLIVQNDSGNGAGIKFKDIGDDTQYGNIEYFHQDSKSYGSGEAFVARGDETEMSFVVKGKVMYEDGLWLAGSADNSTAAVRKDQNWDTAYGWGNHASAGYLTAAPSKASPVTSEELGNVDLDDYAQPADAGFYHQTGNADADTEDNWPNGRAGSLLVQKSANQGNFGTTQLFIDYNHSDVYVRSMYDNSAADRAWKRLYTTSDFTNNSTNWNTAYGWGNHASAGYLTSETHASAGYLTSHQDISGKANKSGANFTGNIARVGTGSNDTYNADTTVMSGYGLIGNRSATVYVTNSNAAGAVQIGVGGAHNANSKLNITTALASFTVPISTSGAITASGNVTAYSDERLKEDVETLDGSKVYEMRGVSYTKDGAAGSGVIAQEMQKVAPELVHDDGEYLSVAYGNTIGYLIEAIKDLKEEVNDLKAKLEDKD